MLQKPLTQAVYVGEAKKLSEEIKVREVGKGISEIQIALKNPQDNYEKLKEYKQKLSTVSKENRYYTEAEKTQVAIMERFDTVCMSIATAAFQNKEFDSVHTKLNEMSDNPKYKQAKENLLAQTNIAIEDAKLEASMVGRSLKRLGLKSSKDLEADVPDALMGNNFVQMAVKIPNIIKDKMIVAVDRFRNQVQGSRFFIYFVTSQNFKIVNRRDYLHLIVAVYASTTGILTIVDSDGYAIEEIKGI